jgi:hypothetical protein
MAQENTTGRKRTTDTSKASDTGNTLKEGLQGLGAVPAPAPRKSVKSNKPTIGGSAVTGARSTQPKKITENANPQQQQLESYNRDQRRRMERIGMNDGDQRAKTIQDQRKKRSERLKQRREEQVARVRKSLPGGKIDTSPRRVYYMVAGVAIAIVLLIVVFAILRANGAF